MFAIISQPLYGPPEPPHIDEILTQANEVYEVTAYTAGDDFTPSHGITASGKRVKAGETVACPRELPLGTRINIEGVGPRVCLDRGGAIKGRKLDVYMPSIKEARKFGRQTLKVTIINEKERLYDEN